MAYEIKNNSDLSVKVARLIKDELIIQGGYTPDVVNIVVNNFDLENRGLGELLANICRMVKTVEGVN